MAAKRYVDTLPAPANARKVKIINLSTPRSGTLGLHRAFTTLGYTSYHMIEMVVRGIPHFKMFNEAMAAADPASGIAPYGRADFDKWFADYDCIVEIPSMVGPSVVEAYIDDPDVKFVMTEREPARFAASFRKSVGQMDRKVDTFPLGVFKYLDDFNWEFFKVIKGVARVWCPSQCAAYEESEPEMARQYAEYIARTKAAVAHLPPDRLLRLDLETGFGWAELGRFLERDDVPTTPYPRANDEREFRGIAQRAVAPGVRAAMLKIGAVLVPALGTAVWFLVQHRRVRGGP